MLFGCDFALYPEHRRNKRSPVPRPVSQTVPPLRVHRALHWVPKADTALGPAPRAKAIFIVSSHFLTFKWLDVSEFRSSRLLRVEDRIVEINHGEILVAPVVLQIVGFPVGIRLFPGQQIDVRQERLLFERER